MQCKQTAEVCCPNAALPNIYVAMGDVPRDCSHGSKVMIRCQRVHVDSPGPREMIFQVRHQRSGHTPVCRQPLYRGLVACHRRAQDNLDTRGSVSFSMVAGVRHRGDGRNERRLSILLPHYKGALTQAPSQPTRRVRTVQV